MARTKLYTRGVNPLDLTDKELAFCHEYIIDFNATAACARAGYSARSANKIGSQLLKKQKIKQMIGKLRNEQLVERKFDKDSVLGKASQSLHRDLADLCNPETGDLITDLRELPKHTHSWVDGIKVKHSYTTNEDGERVLDRTEIEYKLSPNLGVQDMGFKHNGLYAKEQSEITHKIGWDNMFEPPERDSSDEIEDRIKREAISVNSKGAS